MVFHQDPVTANHETSEVRHKYWIVLQCNTRHTYIYIHVIIIEHSENLLHNSKCEIEIKLGYGLGNEQEIAPFQTSGKSPYWGHWIHWRISSPVPIQFYTATFYNAKCRLILKWFAAHHPLLPSLSHHLPSFKGEENESRSGDVMLHHATLCYI